MTSTAHDLRLFARFLIKRITGFLLGLVVAAFALAHMAAAGPEDVLVFAAASQRNALDAVISEYKAESGRSVRAAYQSSSALARQIERGAPADLFVSANPAWMDHLQKRDLIDSATRVDMFGNRLVLVTAKGNPAAPIEIANGFNLARLLGNGRLAVGDPDHVPAGLYAKQALLALGAWDGVAAQLVRAENVRAALALVARGEAAYGIVYASDATADRTVEVAGTFPADSHSRIVYPVAVTKEASNRRGAKSFLDFLRTPKAAKIYRQFGFSILGAATD